MKKLVFMLIAAFAPLYFLSAIDFSLKTGGGVMLGADITRYTLLASGDRNITDSMIDAVNTQKITQFNYGAFLFFDAEWAEVAVFFQGGYNSFSEISNANGTIGGQPIDISLPPNEGVGQEIVVGFSVLGKYPFKITNSLLIFPLLGIEYRIALVEWRQAEGGKGRNRDEGYYEADKDKDGNPHKLSAWNSFWIDIGAGADFSITSNMYLRTELLCGFRLMTVYENDALEKVKQQLNDQNPEMSGITVSPMLRIALAYRIR